MNGVALLHVFCLCVATVGVGRGEDVSGSLCPASPPPEQIACEIPCRMDCVVSEWTEWSSCSQSCSNKNSDGNRPGRGLYWRWLEKEALMRSLHVGRCPESTRPKTVRPCLLCKKDCIVTMFSEWTPCPRLCQPGNATIKQSRYRIIIQEAANGGQECPDTLFEERECGDVSLCPVYRWKPQKWSSSILEPKSVRQGIMGTSNACRKGVQTRAVSCVSDNNQSAEMMECLRQTNGMPPLVQECTVPCRDDCTFSAWSKFTPCSTNCETTRSRWRQLTGKSRKKEKCQDAYLYPLVETEPCPCDVFISQPYGNWSDFLLPEGRREPHRGLRVQGDSKECGKGVHFRAMTCSDKHGRLVDPTHCNSSGKEMGRFVPGLELVALFLSNVSLLLWQEHTASHTIWAYEMHISISHSSPRKPKSSTNKYILCFIGALVIYLEGIRPWISSKDVDRIPKNNFNFKCFTVQYISTPKLID